MDMAKQLAWLHPHAFVSMRGEYLMQLSNERGGHGRYRVSIVFDDTTLEQTTTDAGSSSLEWEKM